MLRIATALALSTLCLAVSACDTVEVKRVTEALRPDKTNPQWFDCVKGETRTPLSPEYKIDWVKVGSVAEAKRQFQNYVAVQYGRERQAADYMLGLEAINFNCWNDTQAQLDFYRQLETTPQPQPPAR